MANRKIPVTITHQGQGIQPPLFVAGTFSDPQWIPHEMECAAGSDGKNTFSQRLEVEPEARIQYKFRVGHGDWWMLDEDAPTVTDDAGNKNNLLEAPSLQDVDPPRDDTVEDNTQHEMNGLGEQTQPVPRVEALKVSEKVDRSATSTPEYARTAAEVADSAAWVDPATPEPEVSDEVAAEVGYRQMTSTPPQEAADTAAEVADAAKVLDTDKAEVSIESAPTAYRTLLDVKDDSKDVSLDIAGFSNDPDRVPLFAHECAGLYEDDEIPGAEDTEGQTETLNGDHHNAEEDFGDPTLERFPSTRDEIINTVKKVESGLNVDQTAFEGGPPSPVVRSRNPSIADVLGESQSSEESPKSPRSARRLSLPRGSISERSASAASLGSIAEGAEGEEAVHDAIEEEDADVPGTEAEASKADDIAPAVEQVETAEEAIEVAKEAEGEIALAPTKPALRPVVTVPSPSVQPSNNLLSPVSDEDEAIVIKNSKDNEKSAETEHSGYLTPERAATPTPEQHDSPGEPAPNAAASVAEDNNETGASAAVAVEAEPYIPVPPSPRIVVSKAEDIVPEELPQAVSVSKAEDAPLDDLPQAISVSKAEDVLPEELPQAVSVSKVEDAYPEDLPQAVSDSKAEEVLPEELPRAISVSKAEEVLPEELPQAAPVSEAEDATLDGLPQAVSVSKAEDAHPEDLPQASSVSSEDGPQDTETPSSISGKSTSGNTGTESVTETAATASAMDDSQPNSLRKRTAPQPNPTDRAGTPAISETGIEAAKSGNWFTAFFRLIFVDWVGGFVRRLCGGKRET